MMSRCRKILPLKEYSRNITSSIDLLTLTRIKRSIFISTTQRLAQDIATSLQKNMFQRILLLILNSLRSYSTLCKRHLNALRLTRKEISSSQSKSSKENNSLELRQRKKKDHQKYHQMQIQIKCSRFSASKLKN